MTNAIISFDLVMEDKMDFVEGTYKLSDDDWCVFIISRRSISKPETFYPVRWESGVRGIKIHYPKDRELNKSVVLQLLTNLLKVDQWDEVRGPDSINLR